MLVAVGFDADEYEEGEGEGATAEVCVLFLYWMYLLCVLTDSIKVVYWNGQ